jgi:uncharacterized protein YbdZ (MbtH family)
VSDPFDDPDAVIRVLVDDEGQHGQWPAFPGQPPGWKRAFADAGRPAAARCAEERRLGARPLVLARVITGEARRGCS